MASRSFFHNPELDRAAEDTITTINPQIVLDVGAGSGFWGKWIKRRLPAARVVAIEVWRPYIKNNHLKQVYDEVWEGDLRSFPFYRERWDMVIFGDVIEHLQKPEAFAVLEKAAGHSQHLLINTPIGHMKQGALDGNMHEVHLSGFTPAELLDFFAGLGCRIHRLASFSVTFTLCVCCEPTCNLSVLA